MSNPIPLEPRIAENYCGSSNTTGFQAGVQNPSELLGAERCFVSHPERLMIRDLIGTWSKRVAVPVSLTIVALVILTLGGLFSNPDDEIVPTARALDVKVVTALAESGY